jgi:hypothetical protein
MERYWDGLRRRDCIESRSGMVMVFWSFEAV